MLLGAIITACISAGGAQAPADEGGPDLELIPISGAERLAWNQQVTPDIDVESLRFVAFVDNVPADLRDVSCPRPTNGSIVYVCSARLPAMTQGTHVIEVAAYLDTSTRLLNPKSWPIRVQLSSRTASLLDTSLVTTDGVHLRTSVLTSDLEIPTGILPLPDGRVMVAEHAGRVRVLRSGTLMPSPALTLADASTGPERTVLAMVADREFENTHAVFLLYRTTSGLRLARYTESNDILSGRAILVEGLPVSDTTPSATLTIGPDGKLYLGLDNGGDPGNQGDLGSFSGKVLRLNKDGTAPAEQAAGTPIYATGLGRPTGMDWSESGKTLWLAGSDAEGSNQLQSLNHGVARGGRSQLHTLPAGVSASGLATYRNIAIPAFGGNLFIADAASGSILRVRIDPTGSPVATEWLLRGQLDGIKAITVAPDGSFYVATSDSVVRIILDAQR